VVILSADANARCAELGAVGFLKKPMKLGALLEAAHRHVGGA